MRKRLMVVVILGAALAGFWIAWQRAGEPPAVETSTPPVPAVDKEAIRTKAELGDPQAQAQLGRLCENQPGAGNRYAEEYALGFDYETGRGVPPDQVAAAKWFRLAAEQGQVLAQYELGQRCALGVGVPADRIEALKWLMLAAAQGQTDAAIKRDTLKKEMTREEISRATRRVETFTPSRPGALPGATSSPSR
ncbi:MAG: tetratricopeptide repeat protein [Verrucomicrobia bacterium]|nr:tetratricopeptide repeat protein [Verrucomicrobiota bacterium]